MVNITLLELVYRKEESLFTYLCKHHVRVCFSINFCYVCLSLLRTEVTWLYFEFTVACTNVKPLVFHNIFALIQEVSTKVDF